VRTKINTIHHVGQRDTAWIILVVIRKQY